MNLHELKIGIFIIAMIILIGLSFSANDIILKNFFIGISFLTMLVINKQLVTKPKKEKTKLFN